MFHRRDLGRGKGASGKIHNLPRGHGAPLFFKNRSGSKTCTMVELDYSDFVSVKNDRGDLTDEEVEAIENDRLDSETLQDALSDTHR